MNPQWKDGKGTADVHSELNVNYQGSFAYKICIQSDFSDLVKEVCGLYGKKETKFCIVTDDVVGPLYAGQVGELLRACYPFVAVYTIPSGEQNKNLDTVRDLYEYLILKHFGRKDVLVALGGGVVGDLTGFTASTFLRGIDFLQIPTTLLAQVDSSIGGKTGVDFLKYKNMVGTFHMPRLVYINTATLETLPEEQFASGMGEVIKYGLIQDSTFFYWLKDHSGEILAKDQEHLVRMIAVSCACKKDVVEEDPTEQGIRAILNFGHTIGHAIEKCANFRLYHGLCVGLGMVAAAEISGHLSTDEARPGGLSREETALIRQVLVQYHIPIRTSEISEQEVLLATKSDKKVIHNKVRFILLDGIGKAVIDPGLSDEELMTGICAVVEG
ncbi:MAG: 3-dehydroquinate synthase [Lachnospiraceae bacterium]|nr:3-dehydroquinate synthase [Lachnospiraceae bacterium]